MTFTKQEEITNEQFTTELNSIMSECFMSVDHVADAIRVSRPTVQRWTQGTSLPHPGMREPIMKYMRKQLQEKRDAALQGS